jgi:seryl-tRNA synthetase
MTAKEYLSQAYRIDQRINSKLEQIRSLRDLATKATAALSDSPVSGTRNVHSMEDTINKIVDLEDEINADIDALVDLKRDFMTVIKQVNNLEHQTLLELRYLCFYRWENIAVIMERSNQHTFRLHDAALGSVQKIIFECESKGD